jgi:hypothetical protein
MPLCNKPHTQLAKSALLPLILLTMRHLHHKVKNLSRGRQLALGGSLLALLAIFMPWHTIGTVTLGTQHSFNGFGDQNLIVGLLTFAFMLGSFLFVSLPLIGVRPPRLAWRESGILLFFGGESSLLTLVLTVMHATSLTRAAHYDLRLGLHLALIGSVLVFLGGYTLRAEERTQREVHSEPLVRPPRTHHPHQLNLSKKSESEEEDKSDDDARMQLDI